MVTYVIRVTVNTIRAIVASRRGECLGSFPPPGGLHIEKGRRGRGGVLGFVCLSHSTIEHASLSRRSTVATPNRDTSNSWALITILPYTRNLPLILPPSCFAACGHHLSRKIAIVFSLLSSVPNFPMSHHSMFLIPFLFVHFTISHYVTSTLYWFATSAQRCIDSRLLPATDIPISSFWQVQVPYTKL